MLATEPEFGATTGRYFHMFREKAQRSDATDLRIAHRLVDLIDAVAAKRMAADRPSTAAPTTSTASPEL